jgi:hypothetical protein
MSKAKGEAEGAPLLEGVLIEGDASTDEGAPDGLELDAQQAAEIRQIFLTSLPDYLVPIKEMVIRLSSEADETGEIRGGLAKTIASIGDAATRMKLDDVTDAMASLREDVLLFGDPLEPQDALRKRITEALASLDRLAGGAAASVRPEVRSETIVAALRGSDQIESSVVQRLLAAGVAYVDQVLDADPKEVAMVSGLDAGTVAKLFDALAAKRKAAREPAAKKARAVPSDDDESGEGWLDVDSERAPRPGADALATMLRSIAQDELSLEEARGQATRLRASIAALRETVATLERECHEARRSIGERKSEAVARLTDLAKVESRKSALDRQHANVLVDLDKAAARLAALQADRGAVLDDLRRLGEDTSALSEHVADVLDTYSTS